MGFIETGPMANEGADIGCGPVNLEFANNAEAEEFVQQASTGYVGIAPHRHSKSDDDASVAA